jgi:hypothetical protein
LGPVCQRLGEDDVLVLRRHATKVRRGWAWGGDGPEWRRWAGWVAGRLDRLASGAATVLVQLLARVAGSTCRLAGEQAGPARWLLGQNGLYLFLSYFLKLFYFHFIPLSYVCICECQLHIHLQGSH